jgi:multisubunit Na+/H+ antiporter MnhC subunit
MHPQLLTLLQCEQPLAIWSLVAGSLLALSVLFCVLDDVFDAGFLSYGLSSGTRRDERYRLKKKLDGTEHADAIREPSCWTAFTVIQTLLVLLMVGIFVYGAYAVLAIFGRQRNASPGNEVCDTRLYDPVFFVVILFDLVIAVAAVLLLCVIACDCGLGSRGYEEDADLLLPKDKQKQASSGTQTEHGHTAAAAHDSDDAEGFTHPNARVEHPLVATATVGAPQPV